jgi:hypothetical protein
VIRPRNFHDRTTAMHAPLAPMRLGDRINAMYVDKLDGRVDTAFFDKMSAGSREEQNRCLREIECHESAEQSYMDGGCRFSSSRGMFERQQPREKHRLLNFILSNCTWEDGEMVATFPQPVDLLLETTTAATRHEAGNAADAAKKTRIEPCALLRRRSFGNCSTKPETCLSLHRTIGKAAFLNTLSSYMSLA